MRTVGEYPLESLQLYFNASLEIQEEMIRHGFRVPRETPLPIVYADMAGYEGGRPGGGILKGAALHPERYGKTLSDMGWREIANKYAIPAESGTLELLLEDVDQGYVVHMQPRFQPGVAGYHLEKKSYAGVGQTFWKNWGGYYLNAGITSKIIKDLSSRIGHPEEVCTTDVQIVHEKLAKGGGHEDTFFVSHGLDQYGIEPFSYSLCMGCWKHVGDYLQRESNRYPQSGLTSPSLDLRLRLEKDSNVPIRLKIGVAKVEEKKPQLMIKISTVRTAKKEIEGVGEQGEPIPIAGKPRGQLVMCDHQSWINDLAVDAYFFLRALCSTRRFYSGIQGPYADSFCDTCYSAHCRPAEWFQQKDTFKAGKRKRNDSRQQLTIDAFLKGREKQ